MGRGWHVGSTTGEVDIYASLVGLGLVLKAELLAYFLYSWFDLLNVMRTMVSFTNNDVKMRLAGRLGISDAFFQYILCFFNELSMEIYGVRCHTALCIVFTEDKF